MNVTVEKLSPVLVELSVEVPSDRVRVEIDRAYADLQRTARVKGFRPGKAPRHVLAHLFGGRIQADVAQKLVDGTLNKVLADRQVQPLSQPKIAPSALRPDDSFSYKARFEVRPEIESVKWEGLRVKRPATEPTDAMVDAELSSLRREKSTLEAPSPERPAQKGDHARIGFTLEVGGKVQDPGEQEIDTEVGGGQLFKEIEEALVGMTVGSSKDVEVTFSERHVNPKLRSKVGRFHIVLKDIKERIFPAIDDELAKDCGHDTLAALRDALRAKVEKELKTKATDVIAEQLVLELCRHNPVPVPPSLVEQQSELAERELLATARKQGQRIEVTPDIRSRIEAESEVKVRAGLLMAEIAKAKQIRITDADIEQGYQELAEQTGKNVAKVKAEYRDQKKREMLIGMILEDKILDLLEAAAAFEGEASSTAAAEPAAKPEGGEPPAPAGG